MKQLKVLELFAGTRSIGKAFEEKGHKVVSVEWNEDFKDIDEYVDVNTLTVEYLIGKYGYFDVVWASPDCTSYSVAGISHHRRKNKETGELEPISEYAKTCDTTNQHVLKLIKELNPTYAFIENPRGGMRKMGWVQDIPRYTVSYCQYGDSRMKPTDIWTNHPNPKFKPMCKNGSPCHTPAPRGSRTPGSTQGTKGSIDRSRIPKLLCEHIVDICEKTYPDYLYEQCKTCKNLYSSLECEMCEDFDMYIDDK
ncbi:MAG TPA: DNA cytosine methyltransferase [Clostridiales bacterium]|nr:DNA cytosine methyltransferase [Clostridiales bacterium]